MNTKIDKSTNDYFEFLANTLSISTVIVGNSDTAEKKTARVQKAKHAVANNTAELFSLLARSLSIATLFA